MKFYKCTMLDGSKIIIAENKMMNFVAQNGPQIQGIDEVEGMEVEKDGKQ